jgi:Na+-transporting NADH:ubiquinone oxidoreductase subunit NqrF
MKYLLFLAFGLSVFTACKKNYVCECTTYEVSNGTSEILPVENFSLSKMKKQQAVDSCNAMDYYSDLPNQKITTNCTLK